MSPASILAATLPVYLMMFAGALARKLGWMPKEADSGLMHLTVRLLYPCLVVERIVGNPALNDPSQVAIAAALGFGLIAAAIGVCYAVTPLIGLKQGEGSRTFALCTGLQNYGFVAIPVTEALFGKELIGVLFTHTLGIELASWTIGIGLLTGMSKAPWKHALNPTVLCILAALGLHYSGVATYVPEFLHKFMGQLGGCAIPLSVLLVGANIMDMMGKEKIRWNVAIASPLLRLAVLPFLFFFAARWIPMSDDLKRVLCVQAAMPAAVFTLVLSRHYGGHAPTAVLVILATSLVSMLTVPWVITFGLRFVGL